MMSHARVTQHQCWHFPNNTYALLSIIVSIDGNFFNLTVFNSSETIFSSTISNVPNNFNGGYLALAGENKFFVIAKSEYGTSGYFVIRKYNILGNLYWESSLQDFQNWYGFHYNESNGLLIVGNGVYFLSKKRFSFKSK